MYQAFCRKESIWHVNASYEVNDGYVSAETVCQLLRQIKKRGFKAAITLVLDNARYQRCHLVQALAESLDIELLFLPSYSPNLNLIERYWKYLKGKLFRCRSIEKSELFCTSIMGILDDRSTKRKEELATLLAPNFQVFDETVICWNVLRNEYKNLTRRFGWSLLTLDH